MACFVNEKRKRSFCRVASRRVQREGRAFKCCLFYGEDFSGSGSFRTLLAREQKKERHPPLNLFYRGTSCALTSPEGTYMSWNPFWWRAPQRPIFSCKIRRLMIAFIHSLQEHFNVLPLFFTQPPKTHTTLVTHGASGVKANILVSFAKGS